MRVSDAQGLSFAASLLCQRMAPGEASTASASVLDVCSVLALDHHVATAADTDDARATCASFVRHLRALCPMDGVRTSLQALEAQACADLRLRSGFRVPVGAESSPLSAAQLAVESPLMCLADVEDNAMRATANKAAQPGIVQQRRSSASPSSQPRPSLPHQQHLQQQQQQQQPHFQRQPHPQQQRQQRQSPPSSSRSEANTRSTGFGRRSRRSVVYGADARDDEDEGDAGRGRSFGSRGKQRSSSSSSRRRGFTAPSRRRRRGSRGGDDDDDDDAYDSDGADPVVPQSTFVSGRRKLDLDDAKKGRKPRPRATSSSRFNPGASLVNNMKGNKRSRTNAASSSSSSSSGAPVSDNPLLDHPLLEGEDPVMIDKICMEIMSSATNCTWDDIAGLRFAKETIQEIIVWPMQRPDLFTGLRAPPKGLLLFGPPGTGKTMLGKAIAADTGATFFNISASSLTSKWVGEGERMVRTLFKVAAAKQPAVIFIDEIDSLLTARQENESESTRRIKTEFLVCMEGAASSGEERILLVGATNLPQELDEAARRRFTKRLYIPLPDEEGRTALMNRLLGSCSHALAPEHVAQVVAHTEGYSGSDLTNLCKEAAIYPIRELQRQCKDIRTVQLTDVRPIVLEDFLSATRQARCSVSTDQLDAYRQWDEKYGTYQ